MGKEMVEYIFREGKGTHFIYVENTLMLQCSVKNFFNKHAFVFVSVEGTDISALILKIYITNNNDLNCELNSNDATL